MSQYLKCSPISDQVSLQSKDSLSKCKWNFDGNTNQGCKPNNITLVGVGYSDTTFPGDLAFNKHNPLKLVETFEMCFQMFYLDPTCSTTRTNETMKHPIPPIPVRILNNPYP